MLGATVFSVDLLTWSPEDYHFTEQKDVKYSWFIDPSSAILCVCVLNLVINYKVLMFTVELPNSRRQNVKEFHVLGRVTILWY